MNKRFSAFLLLSLLVIATYATISGDNDKDKKKAKMQQTLDSLPDSAYGSVKKEDLLNDEVYVKLARDGWSSQEIERIMGDYMKANRNKAKGSHAYGMYAKQWLPVFGHTPGNDSIYQFVDTTYNEEAIKKVRSIYSADMAEYYEPVPYTPDDRMQGRRNKGYFRPVQQKPYTGRIHWIVVHPEDPDKLMVVPDGAGIFRTDDCGKTWDCVTDRIPDREFRKTCYHSAIPVDPDDWNHFFAFMKNGNATRVYETTDGGQTWTRVEGATHKNFKRGYGFRDSEGTMKFIGAVQNGSNYMNNALWISEDKGVTWTQILIPDSLKETHPENSNKGAFLQNFAFDPTDRDKIYFTASRSIYYFDDGARPTTIDGKKTYNVKRLHFNVYAQDGKTLRAENVSEFPYKSTSQGFLEINPNNPDQMWFASASRNVSYGVYSAVYRSDDGGKNWITLQEPKNGIGSGLAFGNESPWGWLGGFGVNFADTTLLYGCSMSSAKSTDGGRTFKEFGWPNRLKALYDDGMFYYTTSARHNADNHCIVSHKSGRVFRGSDAGLLMIDKGINGNEWTNVNGTMGNQLHYSIKVNEFGDQVMLGNTQDVDAQTYKYGRWGNWRGYEGTEAFINPYAGTCYYSGGGGGSLDNISLSSWYEGYTWADVCTGNWYLIHRQGSDAQSLFRISDFGHTAENLSQNTTDSSGAGVGARDMAITRDGGKATIYVINTNNTVVRSTDDGQTFETVMVKVNGNLVPAKYSNSCIAADPDNSYIYLGQAGKVFKINTTTGDVEDISSNKTVTGGTETSVSVLPNECSDLIFHEGTGDLYYHSASYGLYRRDHATGLWEMWMTGYNPLASKRIALNYTTQEIVIADYGRGVWVADIETPADRYFKDGFALKEISNVGGRHTIGIDTEWTIPMYYNYTWTVNGADAENPYQYLTRKLKAGDKVQLKLTLRESPDVSTTSAEFTVPESAEEVTELHSGNALYSDGSGRIDLGYVDYFLDDFTIEMWAKPESDGVLLCNRPVEQQKDTRGWAIMIEGGNLKFRYAPALLFDRATYDENTPQQTDLNAGQITFGQWNHIAVTEERSGSVKIYVNGQLKATDSRIVQWAPLNSALNLSLFADGFERKAITAAVDELKIWNYALTDNDVKLAMYSHKASDPAGLVYYNSFNASKLGEDQEQFSHHGLKARNRAVTQYVQMYHPVAANYADVKELSDKTLFTDNGTDLMYMTQTSGTGTAQMGVYKYVRQGDTIPGINTRYYTPVSAAYLVHNFTGTDCSLDIDIILDNNSKDQYQLYAADINSENKIWTKVSGLTSADAKTLSAKNISAESIEDKLLVVLKNKAAIEPVIITENKGNEVTVYDENDIKIDIQANLVGGLEEPTTTYPIVSKQGIVGIKDYLKFSNNKAETQLTVNADKIKGKDFVCDTIVGKENDIMIPLAIKVTNKSLPKEIGNSTTIANGGLQVGSSQVYSRLNGKKTITMMAWVRIDSESVLSGVKPLLFFRGGTSSPTGLHLSNGNLRWHWNDGYYGTGSNLNITRNDLGRWMHVAFVCNGAQFKIYLNGVENMFTRNDIGNARIGSPLMLGQNSSGDKWFNGAFDQVSVWERALTADEIKKYMQQSPRLDAEGLVAYIDMDHVTEDGNIIESVTDTYLTQVGTVTTATPSTAPYNYKENFVQEGNVTEQGQKIHITEPAGQNIRCHFSVFEGNSYNYMSQQHPELSPLINEHYTILFDDAPKFTASQTVKLTFNMPQFMAATATPTLAIRQLGSEEEFTTFVEASELAEGKAVFTMTGDQLSEAKEFMVMSDITAGTNPVKVTITSEESEDSTIILDSTKDRISIKTRVISKNPDSQVNIDVTETSYASISKKELDMNVSEETFDIIIDKEKINKMALNPVTVKLSGVSEPVEMTFNVALEPILELSLANGTEQVLTVDETTMSLPIKATLKQGVINGKYTIVTETGDGNNIESIVNTGMGNLLSNNNVTIKDNLEFYKGVAETEEGWNLIGNPYLSNVNMTKEQNVLIDESYVLKYMYQYNPENDTYNVWDMVENYDPTQRVAPFHSFFIQTKQEGASLTITPVAKDTVINRKVFSHYMLEDKRKLRISLFAGDNEKESDHTDIQLGRDADSNFVNGEDALKMWGGLNGKPDEIATAQNGRYLAINEIPAEDTEISLYLKLNNTGRFRLETTQITGFSDKDKIELVDHKTGAVWNMNQNGASYGFDTADAAENKSRFSVRIKLDKTGVTAGEEEGRCYVLTDGNECIVKDMPENSTVEIFDLSGIRHRYEKNQSGTYTTTLDNGKYIVRVKSHNKEYTTKIIIQK